MNIKIIVAFLLALSLSKMGAVAQTAKDLYNEGLELKNSKKSSEAAAKFKSAVELDKYYAAAHYELGWCYNDLKNYTAALSSLRKARDNGWSAIPKVFFELGYAYEKLNMPDSAVSNYNRCLVLKPDYKLAHKQLGYISYEKDEYSTALERFKKYEELMQAAQTEISDYLFWYRKGFIQNALKNYAEAKIALNKSLQYKKDYINTYLELGFASTRLKENDEAISFFKKAIETDPNSHIGYNGIGEVYRDNIKNRDEAILWYRKALAVKPNERKASYGIGYCLNAQGKYNEALYYLRTAKDQDPDYVAAYVELGYSYYMTNDYTQSLENLKKALTLNPKNENARYYATLVYVKQGNKTMAQQMVNELKALNSKHSQDLQQKVDRL